MGYVSVADDCDDLGPAVSPGASEACDLVDQDCDAVVDEGADAACAGLPGASAACTAGACALTCSSGLGDCDGVPGNGCETDVTRHAAHSARASRPAPRATRAARRRARRATRRRSRCSSEGTEATLGVTTDGRIFAWGNNRNGVLGDGSGTAHRPGGVYAMGLSRVVHAAMGRSHACAVVEEDDGMGGTITPVYCWGSSPQAGLGRWARVTSATRSIPST